MDRVYDKKLIDDMVRQLSLPLPVAKQSAEEILAIIQEGLTRDGVVNVTHFGTFRLKPVAERSGYNPQTRERITIPAHQRVVFTPAKALRDQVEPERPPLVPILAEQEPTPAVTMAAPLVAIIDIPSDTHHSPEEENSDISIAALGQGIGERSFHPSEAGTQPQPITAQDVMEPVADIAAPALAEPTFVTESVPTASPPEGGELTGSDKPRLLPEQKPVRSSTKRGYYLGAVAIVILLISLAFLLPETSTDAMSVHNDNAAKIEPVTTGPGSEENVISMSQTRIPDALAEPIVTVNDKKVESADSSRDQPIPAESTSAGTEPTSATGRSDHYFNEQSFKIAEGESLWLLADRHYQSAILWPHIFQANTASIDNPDHLREGGTIVVPSLEGSPDKLSRRDRYNIARGYYLAYLFYKKAHRSDAFFALLTARSYDASVVESHP